MESISHGGRPVSGFALGYPPSTGLGAVSGGVCVPPLIAGIGFGAGVAALAHYFRAPTWGVVVSGVGTGIATWAALR